MEYTEQELKLRIKQLDELIDRFTEMTECVSPDLVKSRKLIIEYTPLESIDKTVDMIVAKIRNEINKSIRDLDMTPNSQKEVM